MDENLKSIIGLQGGEWELLHNVAPHQTDSINCGFYVMRALWAISKIEKEEENFFGLIQRALSYDSSQESGTDLRRRIGRIYGVALGYLNPALNITKEEIASYKN